MTLPNMIARFVTAALLGTALLSSGAMLVRPAAGAPPNTIGGSAALCDPWSPQNCAKPDSSGNIPVTGTFSATLGGFAPATTGTLISVTTGGDTGTLPAGAVVVAFNRGTSNTAYCKLGASATTNDVAIPPQSWFAFTVGTNTQLTCITSTSTTTVNMVGGSGLPTGAGGGGGGGGGGGTSSDFGSAFPTPGTAAGFSDGTNMVPGRVIAAGADAVSNSTPWLVSGALAYLYNGTTWDRARGDTTNGMWVNVKASTPTNVAGVVSSSAGSSLVLKASAGGLQTLTVTVGAVSGWLMIFNTTSAPADGAVTPAYCRYVKSDGTGGATSFSWGAYPLTFSTGITAVFSSTGCFTKTASATATFQGQVQ